MDPAEMRGSEHEQAEYYPVPGKRPDVVVRNVADRSRTMVRRLQSRAALVARQVALKDRRQDVPTTHRSRAALAELQDRRRVDRARLMQLKEGRP